MTSRVRRISRVGLFAALIYVLSWTTLALPNVNLAFFLAFLSGLLWGAGVGLATGALGMALWTTFNPFGPAPLPVAAAQVVGLGLSGLTGGLTAGYLRRAAYARPTPAVLVLAAVVCTIAYYLPVNLVDAWLFQPFRARFIAGGIAALVSLGANVIVFPLLLPVVRRLYAPAGACP